MSLVGQDDAYRWSLSYSWRAEPLAARRNLSYSWSLSFINSEPAGGPERPGPAGPWRALKMAPETVLVIMELGVNLRQGLQSLAVIYGAE